MSKQDDLQNPKVVEATEVTLSVSGVCCL